MARNDGKLLAHVFEQMLLGAFEKLGVLIVREELLTLAYDIVFRYGEPHRSYHSLEHILSMFQGLGQKDVKAYVKTLGPYAHAEITLAILYHDIFYVPNSKLNERLSSLYFAQVGNKCRIRINFIANIQSMILATADHSDRSRTTNAENVLLDLDLLGLAAPTPVFRRHSDQLYQEFVIYGGQDQSDYCQDRVRFLSNLLEKTGRRIFRIPPFEVYNEQAAENTTTEIKRLTCQ